eukprot:4574087-Heterocapsa_arctica.AAC.1
MMKMIITMLMLKIREVSHSIVEKLEKSKKRTLMKQHWLDCGLTTGHVKHRKDMENLTIRSTTFALK